MKFYSFLIKPFLSFGANLFTTRTGTDSVILSNEEFDCVKANFGDHVVFFGLDFV
jgi:hypothetical protein